MLSSSLSSAREYTRNMPKSAKLSSCLPQPQKRPIGTHIPRGNHRSGDLKIRTCCCALPSCTGQASKACPASDAALTEPREFLTRGAGQPGQAGCEQPDVTAKLTLCSAGAWSSWPPEDFSYPHSPPILWFNLGSPVAFHEMSKCS